MRKFLFIMTVALILSGQSLSARAATGTQVFPSAILEFQSRGMGLKGYGPKIADALFATLSSYPEIYLVDRQEFNNLLNEYQLNLSGMVNSQQAVQVGQLSGAKLLITGTITEFDSHLILVAKIISTETSRVLGESVKGRNGDDILPLVEELADKVVKTITARAGELVPERETKKDIIETINKEIGAGERPSLSVAISERHVGQAAIDPAAETEIIAVARATQFEVIDASDGHPKNADLLLKGEGFSEFAGRRGELTSVKARLEVRAIDRTSGKILAIDRQTEVEVDLSEHIAGKKALQRAAAAIAARMLPKLAKK
jgi:TolB-like protein